MELTITIKCLDVIEAQQVLAQLRVPESRINPLDNPEAGVNYPEGVVAAQVQQASTPPLADVGFGKGVTLPAGATPVPSTAAAVPSPTVPAVPQASGTPAAPSASSAPAAPTAPVVPAPTGVAPPAASVPGVELDATGLPHDKRIHASTKSKKQDGSWTALRGVDPALKIQVEQELRNLMAMNAAAGGPVVPVAPAIPAVPVAAPVAQTVPMVPVADPAPAPGVAPVTTAAGDPATFAALMERLTPLMEVGKITTDRIGAHLAPMNLKGFGQLALAPNLIPTFWASIKPEVSAAEMGL